MENWTIKHRFQMMGAGLGWILGLLTAGSDGPYMPWVNLLGVLIFLTASLILGKTLPKWERKAKKEWKNKKRLGSSPVVQRMSPDLGYSSRYALTIWIRG